MREKPALVVTPVDDYPKRCPECEHASGMPFKATHQPEWIVVSVQCRECGHRWTFTRRARKRGFGGSLAIAVARGE